MGIIALYSLCVCGVVAFGAGDAVSPFVVVPWTSALWPLRALQVKSIHGEALPLRF